MGEHGPEPPAPGPAVLGPPDEGAAADGHRLFAAPCRFAAAAGTLARLPPADLPEVAFAGRSNVGKSSLINALTRHGGLARTSNTPGRTQEIIFFDLGGRLGLVDLPGYGFARAPKTKIAEWTALIGAYLAGRPTLRRVCLLIDARHGVKPSDHDMMALLDRAAVAYRVVLTKVDKIAESARPVVGQEAAAALAKHPAALPAVALTSAARGVGFDVLRADLTALARPPAARSDQEPSLGSRSQRK